MRPRSNRAPLVAASFFLVAALSFGPACKSSRGPAPFAPGAASNEAVALVEGPCPWRTAGPDAAGDGWRTMDGRLAAATLEEVLGRPAKGFSRVTGCWIGFLGSLTVVSFHAKSAPGGDWGPLTRSDVAGTIQMLAKQLPGLALDPRLSAYDLLGASRERDDNNGNFTAHFLLRRHGTDGYLLIREYSG